MGKKILEAIRLTLRWSICLYPLYCLYLALCGSDLANDNMFNEISYVLGFMVMFGGGIILFFSAIAVVVFLLQFAINWIFDDQIFD